MHEYPESFLLEMTCFLWKVQIKDAFFLFPLKNLRLFQLLSQKLSLIEVLLQKLNIKKRVFLINIFLDIKFLLKAQTEFIVLKVYDLFHPLKIKLCIDWSSVLPEKKSMIGFFFLCLCPVACSLSKIWKTVNKKYKL